MVRLTKKRRRKMKKSLLVWGVLIALALCFVGCCYYSTTHCTHGATHCHQKPKCDTGNCPDNADDTVETMTVEAVEIIPVGNQDNTPAASGKKALAPVKKTPAMPQTATPATPAAAPAVAPANN